MPSVPSCRDRIGQNEALDWLGNPPYASRHIESPTEVAASQRLPSHPAGWSPFCFPDSQLPFHPHPSPFPFVFLYFPPKMCFLSRFAGRVVFGNGDGSANNAPQNTGLAKLAGLSLFSETNHSDNCCNLCERIAKKKRRLTKMTADIERWRRDGNRPATVERTQSNAAEILASLSHGGRTQPECSISYSLSVRL